MKTKLKNIFQLSLVLILTGVLAGDVTAQVYSNKVVGKKNQEAIDSIKQSEWPYMLPIWGKKAVELGFDIPYSAGLGINYLHQESDISISDLQVGFTNTELFNLDEIIRFNDAVATSNIVNVRPDIWLFPFLNVYGIFAQSQTSTFVDFGIWVPNEEGGEKIIDYATTADFDASSFGFGITPTVGIGGGWLALDMNWTWTDITGIEEPSTSFVFGPRLGKSFQLKNPQSNIAVWVGGFRAKFVSKGTSGSIPLNEVLPDNGTVDNIVTNGQSKIEQKQTEVDQWYESLTPTQQKLNQIKYEAANRALGAAYYLLDELGEAAENVSASTVRYDLNKQLADKWNFIIGAQYQLNKHWMIRAEYGGLVGSRKQILTGLQYRFGL